MKKYLIKIKNVLTRIKNLVKNKEKINFRLFRLFCKNIYFFKLKNKSPVIFSVTNYTEYMRARTFLTKEPETINWIDNFFINGDVFYDIGANVGTFSIYAAMAFDTLVVYSFEPHAPTFTTLCKNIQLNNLNDKIIPYSLGIVGNNNSKLSSLNWMALNSGSSTHQVGRTFDHLNNSFQPQFNQGISIFCIDDLIINKIRFPNHIKIDVDGIEQDIIDGAINTIQDKRLKTCLVEITKTATIDISKIIKIFTMANFSLLNKPNYMNIGDTYNFIFVKSTLM